MKNKLRDFFWKILGSSYYRFLKNQNTKYLKDVAFPDIGDGTYDNGAKVWFWREDVYLKIGKYCSIANDVSFICDSGFHSLNNVATFPIVSELFKENELFILKGEECTKQEFQSMDRKAKAGIDIGNDVWIGANATILPGVNISTGAVVLAGAVVSKDVPAYAVVGGIPAQIVQYRFEENIIKQLLSIAWWDWDKELIKSRVGDFYMPIEFFCKRYYKCISVS